jgi:hypothetical protein
MEKLNGLIAEALKEHQERVRLTAVPANAADFFGSVSPLVTARRML